MPYQDDRITNLQKGKGRKKLFFSQMNYSLEHYEGIEIFDYLTKDCKRK
jgi:hypothetical protein